MVRPWIQVPNWQATQHSSTSSSRFEGLGSILLVLWAVVVSICFVSAVILSCADGSSREKDTNTETYAAGCGAGCGGGCGGWSFICLRDLRKTVSIFKHNSRLWSFIVYCKQKLCSSVILTKFRIRETKPPVEMMYTCSVRNNIHLFL